MAKTGSEQFIAYAVTLSLMVGVIQVIMGVARLGFLTNFLSHPVLSGFTSAAALIIGFSQLGHLLGLKLPRSHHVHEIVMRAVAQVGDIHTWTFLIGVLSVVSLLALKRVDRRFPSALVVAAAGTLLVWGLGLSQQGVLIVGDVPAGLPRPDFPVVGLDTLRALFPMAVAISLVGFMESIAVAKAFARRQGYEVDSNQELIGLGMANLGGSVFQAYPVTGGFSRTAVNAEAGARTGLASLITAAVVALTLVFLTPLFHHLPKAVLAAIIMTAVFGLVDVRAVRHLWRVKRSDLTLMLTTFLATLAAGIEQGILIGVGASLLWFVVRTTRPHFAVLGRLPGTRTYRNVKRHPEAERVPGVLVVRMDAQFYFGNMSFLRETLRRLEQQELETLRAVVIDGTSINNLDSSADAALHEIEADYARRGIVLYLTGVKGPVLDVLHRSGLFEKLGAGHFFLDVADAVEALQSRLPQQQVADVGAPGPPLPPQRGVS
jgi:SulP family sulfate permease